MICVSLAEPDLRACLAALEGLPMAEIRLDLTPLSMEGIGEVFRRPLPLVATFRPGRVPAAARAAALEAAIRAGAAYVDVEAEAPPAYRDRIVRAARRAGCRVILSSHSAGRPSGAGLLARKREALFRKGADVVKIVRRAVSVADVLALLSLYDTPKRGRVIALGTGRAGVVTRIAAPLLGAPFTYASSGPGRETAAGQLDWRTLERILELVAHG